MRKTLFYILLFFLSFNKLLASPDSIAMSVHNLSDSQKVMLFQFATLQHYASQEDAEAYWQKHQQYFTAVSERQRQEMATEIYKGAEVKYKIQSNSPVHIWLHAQTLTNWLLYAAMFIAIIALIRIIYAYWDRVRAWFARWLYPVFRYLFSPVVLTYELLGAGLLLVYYGVAIQDMVVRTILVHVGIFICWAQLSALLYKQYFFREYFKEMLDRVAQSYKDGFAQPLLPALLATFLYAYAIWKLPGDGWYYCEIVAAAFLSLYALPFVRKLEPKLSVFLLPFPNMVRESNKRILHYTIILLLLSVAALVWLPPFLFPSATGVICIYFLFLLLSSVWGNKQGLRNYIYQQIICFACIVCLLIASHRQQWPDLLYLSVIAFIAFIIIRYWELPVIFGTKWTKKNVWWGLLGQAFILWLIAQGLQYMVHELPL